MLPSALVTLLFSSARRGAFSASTRLFASELTSTPEPDPRELTSFAAADLAAALPVGVLFDGEVEVVAVTMIT
jgi:hypothetical protein